MEDFNDNADKVDEAVAQLQTATEGKADKSYVDEQLEGKADKSDIPTTLPADGGNADTVDGKHASELLQNLSAWTSGSVKDLLLSAKSGFVFIQNSVTNMPADNFYWFGYVHASSTHRQLVVGNISTNAMFVISYNSALAEDKRWTSWKNLADGGDTATLNGVSPYEYQRRIRHGINIGTNPDTTDNQGLYFFGKEGTTLAAGSVATSDAIKEKANGAAEEILNLTDEYQKLGEAMTPEDAEKIKDNLDIIGSGIKENLGYYTQTLVDNLKTSFHDLAVQMGLDVDDMVGKWYLLENMGSSALANLRKDADELSAKIFSGDASDEDYAKFNETVRKMATVDTHTSEQEGLNRAFANITNGSIDFENESQVTDAINDLLTSADTAAATIREAWDKQSADLKNYRDTLVNWGVDTAYDDVV